MKRVYNFSPGPATLPLDVLKQIQAELLDWRGTGVSVMEIGHRTDIFMPYAAHVIQQLRELLNVPANYHILFLPGGARVQFAAIPLNICRGHSVADYIDTGYWSQLALQEAKKYIQVNVAASAAALNYHSIPAPETWQYSEDAAYLHYTANETFLGIEFPYVPQPPRQIPVVADMTSNFISQPLDVSQFGLIYAAAQKNAGISGMTIVIVRDDLVNEPSPLTPLVYHYQNQAKNHSLLVTPPVFCWYVAGLVFDWINKEGGLAALAMRNQRKAQKLYSVIDEFADFYLCDADKKYRSRMNVSFYLKDKALEERFLQEAEARNLYFLKGHSVTGGIRASIYNFIEEQGIDELAGFMREFVQRAP